VIIYEKNNIWSYVDCIAQDLPRYYQFQYISYFSTWILVLSPIPAIALYIIKRMK